MSKCSECEFSDIWPTGEGLCEFRDKVIEGNNKACINFSKRDFNEPKEMKI